MRLNIALGTMLILLAETAGAECMGPYPPSMVRAFNQNCAKQPSMQPFCGCIIDEVQKNIPLADFIEIGNSPSGINNDPRFIKASQKCTPLLSGEAPAAAVAPVAPVAAPGTTTAAGASTPVPPASASKPPAAVPAAKLR